MLILTQDAVNISNVTIIGAGPSGLYLARELSKVMNVKIFEEDRVLGMPPHCTGLVNLDSLKVLGITPPIINTYRYVRITDLEGNDITFDFRRRAIAMVDRPGLEHYLIDEAGSVTLNLGERVMDLGNGVLTTRSRQETYELAIIAEGSSAVLAKKFIPWQPNYVYGVQTDTKTYTTSNLMPRGDDEIVVIFDRRLSSHYFAWIVPRDYYEFRVGIADDLNTWVKFTELLKIIEAERYKPFGGRIVIGGAPERVTAMGNVAVIGDAAGFVKPMTGGGIIMGMLSAKLLSESIYGAIKEGLSINDALQMYDMAYRKFIKNRVKALSAASYVLHMLINNSLSNALKLMSKVDVEVYDYDDHVNAIMRAFVKRPSVFARVMYSIMSELSFIEPRRISELIKNVFR